MSSNQDPESRKALRRAEELLDKRKTIMKLSPDEAMEKILASSQPAALVHSFPEEDFHFLVRDIGPEDSLPLLALASKSQWEYILDVESWRRDRIETSETGRWLDLFLNADSRRMIRWFLEDRTEFVEFYLHKFLEIVVREHDQDPSDFGDDFFTLDGTFYVRIVDPPVVDDPETDGLDREIRRRFLENFLDRLAKHDFDIYQKTLLETMNVIPSETEEEAFRLRGVRMAEKGFPPFDEAVGIYQPMTAEEVENKRDLFSRGAGDPVEMSLYRIRTPLSLAELADGDDEFSMSLKNFSIHEALPMVEAEFAALCNQIVSADQITVKNRDQLRQAVKKACGYLSIGMDRLAGEGEKLSSGAKAAIVERYPLNWIFRAGWGRALELKWRAKKWLKNSWSQSRGLPLTFWDEQWMGTLGGLLIKKPLFFDNYETGVIYREFQASRDVMKTGRELERIMAVDRLLASMDIGDLSVAPGRLLTYKNLLLTLWAAGRLGLPEKPLKIKVENFVPFHEKLFDMESGEGAFRPVSSEMKEDFAGWISKRAGLKSDDVPESLSPVFEALFREIESECSMVAPKHLDPRFVNLFLLE